MLNIGEKKKYAQEIKFHKPNINVCIRKSFAILSEMSGNRLSYYFE